MKKIIVIAGMILAFPLAVSAEDVIAQARVIASIEQDSIALEESKCLEKESTTQGMRECIGTAIKAYDVLMNKLYKEILQGQNTTSRVAIQNAQRAWIKYRDADMEARHEVPCDGSMCLLTASVAAKSLVRDRVIQLYYYTQDMN